jgi:hypothetical protein
MHWIRGFQRATGDAHANAVLRADRCVEAMYVARIWVTSQQPSVGWERSQVVVRHASPVGLLQA